MKPFEIFRKTQKFIWIKLGLGFAKFLLALLLGGLFFGLTMLMPAAWPVMLVLWLVSVSVLNLLLNHWLGYMVKAGHIAVVTAAVTNGQLPENQLQYAKDAVKQRFVTANVYFFIDRAVSGAVRQLQNGIDRVGNALEKLPGIGGALGLIASFAKLFVGIALGYVDECCLAYTFSKPEEKATKCAADGVVLYFQNWKQLLKNSALLALAVMGLSLVAGILPFALFWFIASAFITDSFWVFFVALMGAVFIAAIIKDSFVDSYIMTKMVASYMQTAAVSEVKFDLYAKCCKLSRKFKSLFDKAVDEDPNAFAAPAPAMAAAGAAPAPIAPIAPAASAFCTGCGAPVTPGSAFCTGCGKPL